MFDRVLNITLLLIDFGEKRTGVRSWTLHAQYLITLRNIKANRFACDQIGVKQAINEQGTKEFIDKREQYHLYFWPMQDNCRLPSTKVL